MDTSDKFANERNRFNALPLTALSYHFLLELPPSVVACATRLDPARDARGLCPMLLNRSLPPSHGWTRSNTLVQGITLHNNACCPGGVPVRRTCIICVNICSRLGELFTRFLAFPASTNLALYTV